MQLTDYQKGILPKRFHSLDALRGLAALAVVLSHWKLFFFQGTEQTQFNRERQPLYFLFEPLYTEGWRAVDLFFCLSGFIFFWLYSEKIQRRETLLKEFFVLRFSRLYPLHFLTLLLVVAGQQIMLWRYGSFFVVAHNDLYHFGLQTVFASNWGFEAGYSFNAPIWSVSVEILCYALFFPICVLNCHRWWQLALYICGGYFLMRIDLPEVGRGVFSFFIGGLSFQIFGCVLRRSPPRIALQFLGWVAGLLWILIPLNLHHNLLHRIYKTCFWNESFNFHGKDIGGAVLLNLTLFSYELVLYPLTVVTLALWETQRGTLAKRLAVLGDISYSSYLLHFPLQLLFAGVVLTSSAQVSFFYSPWALLLFFLVLIPLSLCCYKYFERPSQSLIRARALRRS